MVAKKSLGEATAVKSLVGSNGIFVEIGGSVRRISLDDFQEAINEDKGELLQSIAWGVPIKQELQTSPEWGTEGNVAMWNQFKAQIGRYGLSLDGTKAAKLNASDSTKYADGTALDTSKVNVMVHAPRLYFHVAETGDAGIPHLWMSEYPIGGHYIPEMWLGAYMGNVKDGKLRSIPGVTPTGNQSIQTFWNQAQALGKDYGLIDYDHVRLLNMLNLSNYGNANSQENVGYGCCGDGNTWDKTKGLLTGATASLGDACGKIDISATAGNSKSSRVSLFGVEDFWGWYWQMVQNVFFGSSANAAQTGTECFIYEGNRMPSNSELTTHPVGEYRQIQRLTTDWAFISSLLIGEYFDLMPTIKGGDSNSHWCDANVASPTGQLLLWGGLAYGGAICGSSCSDSYDGWAYADANIGSRLAYYGQPQIVTGKAM